ncbi:MAG: hypothetical protein O7G84_00810 [Gammaproteobacteria bacterium]|nr:hypothetical protein [Gammaproteobacteria bacterium]
MAISKHRPRVAASNSFTPGQIKLMGHILKALPSVNGMDVIVRHKDYAPLTRKIQQMSERVRRVERAREVEDRLAQVVEGT